LAVLAAAGFAAACDGGMGSDAAGSDAGDVVAESPTEQASDGTLSLGASVDPTKFVATSAVLTFEVQGAQLTSDRSAVRILNGGVPVSAEAIDLKDGSIVATGILSEGINELVVLAEDSAGNALSYQATLWAGSQTLKVSIRAPDGTVPDSVALSARLSDDPRIGFDQTSTTGQVVLQNVPDRTIQLSATTSANQIANLAITGAAGSVQMALASFNAPSTVDNNDFSQGLAGWVASREGTTSIVPHLEISGPSTLSATSAAAAFDSARAWASIRQKREIAAGPQATIQATVSDMDLLLSTWDEGPSSVSRTFQVAPGTSAITIRYRYVTGEIPGGFFGSRYNDSFFISARSLNAGGSISYSNAMNGLGLNAFDVDGSTAWRTLSLPVAQSGDTVQVDATVTNVGDGQYDSQVIIDDVAEPSLSVTASATVVCPNETVTFTASGGSASAAAWTGGGTPAAGSGASFATRYSAAGDPTARATANGNSADASVHVKEASGAAWVARFPTSTSTSDLESTFQGNVESFITALQDAGASVSIAATYRPAERAYLMHYSYRIAKKNLDPATVPAMPDVDICWVHRDVAGNLDIAAARAAALQMVNGYGIAYAPALQSRHTQHRAIDMSISWTGNLAITDASGNDVTITTTPLTGAGNTALHGVGAGYGVHKLVSDPPHWSDDGH
jgi:hypothetical protein